MKAKWKWSLGIAALVAGGVVLGIVALIGLGTPVFIRAQQNAKKTAAAAMVSQVHAAFHSHYTDYGGYPVGSAKDVFDALGGKNPRGVRFLVIKSSPGGIPLDPWNREIVFTPGTAVVSPRVHSMGPDGIDQGGAPGSDDVR